MSDLMEIKEFIQRIAQGITFAIGIDTQVIDNRLQRVAGTVYKPVPKSGGVVKQVIETGEYAISTSVDRNSSACLACNQRQNCKETGYIHCPIVYNDEVVGVMGLICYEQEHIEKVKDERRGLLNFIQSMCELIELKLKEEDVRRKEQVIYRKLDNQNQVLNQVLEQISDGYVLLNANNIICNINKKAMNLFKMEQGEAIGKNILDLIPDPVFHNMIMEESVNIYENITIGKESYGALFYKVANGREDLAKILNFKTIKNVGSRVAGEAYRENQITFDNILGESMHMRRLKDIANKVAKTMPNILLTGETGTGKEMFARAIHNASDRCGNPFITVNCAAIPMELLESELFGYDEGAFTGAKKGGKIGKFEMANTGTILLDEIGDMPFHLQAKLLRVLQERKLDRLGSSKQIDLNIRIISATNKDLEKMVDEGQFREDLYYRLNIFEIHLPPLRERPEDIPLLVRYFMNKYRSFFGVNVEEVSKEAMDYLCRYQWKGNIRELENVVQYMISMSADNLSGGIGISSLPVQILEVKTPSVPVTKQISGGCDLKTVEMAQIKEAIKKYGNTTEGKKVAAKNLGISLATLYRRLNKEV
ncbi:sigma-54 interaction domain-containing protein [Lacrimispora indolis]|uniref:sigma-54 interaction domain-containing protein n=1 Tax=Lacrimispora indolis TaxID=69825 RepID=UPI00045E5D56|nr:sigma 54-interacting transcriptional regulator [Lacrimispora indolis]MBE7721839.1 PAS domain-containing protein [Lacrimispora celerecrescens]